MIYPAVFTYRWQKNPLCPNVFSSLSILRADLYFPWLQQLVLDVLEKIEKRLKKKNERKHHECNKNIL